MEFVNEKTYFEEKDFLFRIYTSYIKMTEETKRLHCHEALELIYCVSGTGTCYIGDKVYEISPKSIFVINNSEFHNSINKEKLQLKVMYFSPEIIWQDYNVFDYKYLQVFFERKKDFNHCLSPDNPKSEEIAILFYEIQKEWEEKNVGYQLIIKALLMKVLALIYRGYFFTEQGSQKMLKFQKDFDRIKKAVYYIDQNYFERNLNLNELAKMCNFSRNYFSKLFNDIMSVSINDYINKKRVARACSLLESTQLNICNIALKSGFNDLSHFNKIFKTSQKLTPKEYRVLKN